jgi:plastocyanin
MRADSIDPRTLRLALLAGLGLALGAGTAAAQPAVTIDVFDFDFGNAGTAQHVDPTITVGETVRWHFVNGLHSTTSVVGIAEVWDSGDQTAGFDFDHTFTNVGVFPYYCDQHGFDVGNGTAGGMSGIVTVPEPAPTVLAGVASAVVFGLRRRGQPRPSQVRSD